MDNRVLNNDIKAALGILGSIRYLRWVLIFFGPKNKVVPGIERDIRQVILGWHLHQSSFAEVSQAFQDVWAWEFDSASERFLEMNCHARHSPQGVEGCFQLNSINIRGWAIVWWLIFSYQGLTSYLRVSNLGSLLFPNLSSAISSCFCSSAAFSFTICTSYSARSSNFSGAAREASKG